MERTNSVICMKIYQKLCDSHIEIEKQTRQEDMKSVQGEGMKEIRGMTWTSRIRQESRPKWSEAQAAARRLLLLWLTATTTVVSDAGAEAAGKEAMQRRREEGEAYYRLMEVQWGLFWEEGVEKRWGLNRRLVLFATCESCADGDEKWLLDIIVAGAKLDSSGFLY